MTYEVEVKIGKSWIMQPDGNLLEVESAEDTREKALLAHNKLNNEVFSFHKVLEGHIDERVNDD